MNEVVKQDENRNLPTAGIDYAADVGKGTEGADSDSYAIPFLVVLQPLSPQIDAVPNAKPGKFLNSVTNELYDTPLFVPCSFQRRFVRWAPRASGGGFKGEFTPAQVNELRLRGEVKELDGRLYFPLSDGSVNADKSDRCADTRNHYGLLLRTPDDDLPVQMVFALASTGIKVSKNFISRIDAVRIRGGDGVPFKPASFSHQYVLKTTLKTNEKGKWWQPDVDNAGQVKPAVYHAAKAFYTLVSTGKVDVAHDSVRDVEQQGPGNDGDERV